MSIVAAVPQMASTTQAPTRTAAGNEVHMTDRTELTWQQNVGSKIIGEAIRKMREAGLSKADMHELIMLLAEWADSRLDDDGPDGDGGIGKEAA
jgi:hypothetical protein